jgi:hypothetical protein
MIALLALVLILAYPAPDVAERKGSAMRRLWLWAVVYWVVLAMLVWSFFR